MKYFDEPAEWYQSVAANLATQEIKPYAQLFESFDRIRLFDCGANRGLWTRAAIETFSPRPVESHIFEPSSRNCAFMADREHGLLYSDAQFESITINQQAVSDKPGELELFSDWDGSWLGSLVNRPDVAMTQSIKVPVSTVDSYCSERGIEAIDILKLDIEGSEFKALQGSQSMLSKNAIKLIIFEFTVINVYTRTFFHDFWELLTPQDFELFLLNHKNELIPIPSYEGRWEIFSGTTNFVARHRSLDGTLPRSVRKSKFSLFRT